MSDRSNSRSGTPRTDAWEKDFNFSNDGVGFTSYADAYHAALKLARQLERELMGARSESMRPVPDGWKLVPVQPDMPMLNAAIGTGGDHYPLMGAETARRVWTNMLAAAPSVQGERDG